MGRSIQWLYPRVEALLAQGERPTGPSAFVAKLKRPELVEDGERNHWITSVALAYKWSGMDFETALSHVEARLQLVPGADKSRNCRQARSIVKNIYRRLPQTFGMFAHRDLPEWLSDQIAPAQIANGTSSRRGVAPSAFASGQGREQKKRSDGVSDTKLSSKRSPFLSLLAPDSACALSSVSPELASKWEEQPSFDSPGNGQRRVSLVAIRRKQRVGIFDGENLVFCVTRRHYQAHKAIEVLSRFPQFAGCNITIHTPHKAKHAQYFAAIDGQKDILQGALVFGAKRTFADKIAAWRGQGEILEPESHSDLDDMLDPPF